MNTVLREFRYLQLPIFTDWIICSLYLFGSRSDVFKFCLWSLFSPIILFSIAKFSAIPYWFPWQHFYCWLLAHHRLWKPLVWNKKQRDTSKYFFPIPKFHLRFLTDKKIAYLPCNSYAVSKYCAFFCIRQIPIGLPSTFTERIFSWKNDLKLNCYCNVIELYAGGCFYLFKCDVSYRYHYYCFSFVVNTQVNIYFSHFKNNFNNKSANCWPFSPFF